jgi:uracil-DNA glycosylase family 4
VIVTLGSHALDRFVNGAKVSACHGTAFSHPSNIPIFVMYHPAAALYNPGLKSTVMKDFKRLKKFIDDGCKIDDKEKQISLFTEEKQKVVNEILDL